MVDYRDLKGDVGHGLLNEDFLQTRFQAVDGRIQMLTTHSHYVAAPLTG